MAGAEYNDRAVKKLLATLAVLLALALGAYGLGSLRWRPAHRSGPARLEDVVRGGGPLLAGAAVVPLAPRAPVPVAGYPRLKWMEEGRRDQLAVRALALLPFLSRPVVAADAPYSPSMEPQYDVVWPKSPRGGQRACGSSTDCGR